jgi:S1-C subfamily serine protease
MSMDDDADDDGAGIGPPLPPDDRLWRHPSELTAWGAGTGSTSLTSGPDLGSRGSVWPIAVLAGLIGAALCGGALAVTGTFADDAPRAVVTKVAVTPVVSTPIIGEEGGVAALTEKLAPAIVRLVVTTQAGTASASGVVVSGDGLVYTSAHEVAEATSLTVELADGRRVDGEVVGADLPTDVAVVAVHADDLTVAVVGSSAALAVGSPAVALGWPRDGGGEPSVTTGVVSAVDQRLDGDGESLHGLIQTDAPIEAAWSGGPLVDANGAVIGITTDLAGEEAGFGFATPIDLVQRIAAELIESGQVTHSWLGLEVADLSMADAEQIGVPGGAAVQETISGGPAARCGLEADDVITEVGGLPVVSSSSLVVALRHHRPGDEVAVAFWRDGRRHEVTVTLDAHP